MNIYPEFFERNFWIYTIKYDKVNENALNNINLTRITGKDPKKDDRSFLDRTNAVGIDRRSHLCIGERRNI